MKCKRTDVVTVIVVNWNGEAFLPDCLDGLATQTFNRFKTIVVDNGSTDGSRKLLKTRYPEVKLLEMGYNSGFCAANNAAIKFAETPYVALLNNDAVPAPNWLSTLVDALEHCPSAGFAASKLVFRDHPEIIDRAGDGYTIAGAGIMRGRGEPAGKFITQKRVLGASAAAAIYRKEMLNSIGGFDEDFFLIYEDVDLSLRAQLRGYECLFVPDSLVYHGGSQSIGRDSDVSIYYGHRNLEWVWLKNMPIGVFTLSIPYHIVYDMGSMLTFTAMGRLKPYFKAKLDAMKGLKKNWKKRKEIQKNRLVGDYYFYRILCKDRVLSRISRRRSSRK